MGGVGASAAAEETQAANVTPAHLNPPHLNPPTSIQLPDYSFAFEGSGSADVRPQADGTTRLSHGHQAGCTGAVQACMGNGLQRCTTAAPLTCCLPVLSPAFTQEGFGCYYHCDSTRQLNERYGDVQHRIQVRDRCGGPLPAC